jgi:glycerophosphoryl diester phosphodiesterase
MIELRYKINKRPLLVGHRGAMSVAPENTFASFEAGLAGGADILELDVQLTADQQVVVFHDTDLFNKTGLAGRIGDHSLATLRSLDVGSYFDPSFAGLQIPLLSEVLAWAKDRIQLMIELKHGAAIFESRLDIATLELIEDFNMIDQTIIISFDQFALQRVKQINPKIATSFIYVGRFRNPLQLVEGLDVHALSPATDFLTAEEVTLIQDAGYACSPGGFWWDYEKLREWGVDTISSNDPASIQMPLMW